MSVHEGIGQHPSVTPVVFRAGHRVTLPKAIQLLGVDGKDGDLAIDQGFHDRPPWSLDRHGQSRGVASRQGDQLLGKLAQRFAAMLDGRLQNDLSPCIENTHDVKALRPIDADPKLE
jgi:hypothetical protein